ncbi:MAG: alpha/beta hydrolase [Desulfotignum sp.]|nr:alpha/beta hydrolase [Desulfotignum sp.]
MESAVIIQNQTIRLQARLSEGSGKRGVVITHPHPLYGGNMDNPVVLRTAAAFAQKGITTLRFNFRGTGGSTGMYDNCQGEQSDVRAALEFMKDKGCESLYLAGYSFGSRVNASVVAGGYDVLDHIMISPPVAFMSFDDIVKLPSTGLILTGQDDDIAPPDKIRIHIDRWQITPRFEIIPGCDHFYSGCLGHLEARLSDYLS